MTAILPHQASALSSFVESETHGAAPPPLAIILGGSIAKGWHNEHSDVDVMVLVPDEVHAAHEAADTLAFWDERFLEGGCGVDIKYVTQGYLDEAADHGNEPTRAAFRGVQIAYADSQARRASLEDLFNRITTYPEAGVDERILAYLAQVETMKWYIGEAAKRNDAYLASWVASRAVLFGCRAILAHNRVLFPFHKWLLRAVESCPDKPSNLLALANQATREPSKPNVEAFCDAVLGCDQWPTERPNWGAMFMRDTEQTWRHGSPGLEHG